MNHGEITSFIWGVADLIRDTFKRGKYQDVILPLTVLRRLDCVLAPTKPRVLAVHARYRGRIEDLRGQLRRASGFAFYNTSRYDFAKLLADAPNIAQNLRHYIAGFSANMREVLEKFDFDNTISKLDEAGLLFQVVQRFGDPKVNLHPDAIDNFTMGTIFEELIRKFNEALNENPGEHFTPRDVVHLMVDLMLAGDESRLRTKGVVLSVHDPCCGSGGMLTIAKEHINVGERRGGKLCGPAANPEADIHLFGQEVNPETFAICKSDLFMKSEDGRDAESVLFGSTLSDDRHARTTFDYMIANPPYGKDWKRDQDAVHAEHDRGNAGRFGPGLPRISDGQLLFLLNMLAHSKERAKGGSRIAIIMNGSPLFTGDAGSGESEIRRWILENDLARSADCAARAALLQHRHRDLRLGAHEPETARATRQGPAHRCHLVLGAAAQEPGRQAPRDSVRPEGGHPSVAGRFRGRCDPRGRPGWRGARGRRQPRLPDHALRIPQDHAGAPAPARLPGQPGADRTARRGDAPSSTWRCHARRAPRRTRPRRRAAQAAGCDPCPAPDSTRQALPGPSCVRRPNCPRRHRKE